MLGVCLSRYLSVRDVLVCQRVNQFFRKIFQNDLVWLELIRLSFSWRNEKDIDFSSIKEPRSVFFKMINKSFHVVKVPLLVDEPCDLRLTTRSETSLLFDDTHKDRIMDVRKRYAGVRVYRLLSSMNPSFESHEFCFSGGKSYKIDCSADIAEDVKRWVLNFARIVKKYEEGRYVVDVFQTKVVNVFLLPVCIRVCHYAYANLD